MGKTHRELMTQKRHFEIIETLVRKWAQCEGLGGERLVNWELGTDRPEIESIALECQTGAKVGERTSKGDV